MPNPERHTGRRASTGDLQRAIGQFVAERDWEQFHGPRNLAIAISVEAAELLDLFKWSADESGVEQLLPELQDEIADVVIYSLSLCNHLGLDVSAIVEAKLAKNRIKYPVERYRGRWQ